MKRGKSGSTRCLSLKRNRGKGGGDRARSSEDFREPVRLGTRKSSDPQGLRYDEYRLSGKEWLNYGVAGVAGAAAVAYVFYRSMTAFVILVPLGLCYPFLKRRDLRAKRLQRLKLEFKEGILILSSFLSAGYSVENAFAASVRELTIMYGAEGLITREFEHMAGQIRMNRPVEQLFMDFGERSRLDDVKNFAEVFAAAKRSGGELVAIINHTTAVIRDKVQVQEEIEAMTAARQFEQKIMNLIPFFLVLYIDFSSPGFFDLMYGTAGGRWIMTICLAVCAAAYAAAGRILDIEV